jgi:transcriptional regulator with XRE-family HTH domain
MSAVLDPRVVGAHVRRLRQQADLTLRALAEAAGFSPSFISQVETGQVSPSIHSMERIAGCLGTTLGSLFGALQSETDSRVIRARDRRGARSLWSRAKVEAVGPLPPDSGLESLLITLRPGGRSGTRPFVHAAREFIFVLEGRATLRLGAIEWRLGPGDAVVVQPREEQLWSNAGRVSCRILVIAIRT